MAHNNYGQDYSTTSYGAQGGAGGGGFMSQGGSQEGNSSKTYSKDTLRPVTIKQALEAEQPYPEADMTIDGQNVTQITFVGQIRNIASQTTNTTYRIDDGTGIIEVKQYMDSDAANKMDTDDKPKMAEQSWVRVFGRLKNFNNKRHVGTNSMRLITDFNEIQYHLLEATVVHLQLTRGPPAQPQAQGTNGAYGQQAAGVHPQGSVSTSGKQLPAMSMQARKVYNALESTPQNNEGLHMQVIAASAKMEVSEVQKGGEELLSNGLIYTTVDDDTWALMDY